MHFFLFNIHHREICQVVYFILVSHEKTGLENLGPSSKILPLVNEEMEIRTQSRATAAPSGGQWRNGAQLLIPQWIESATSSWLRLPGERVLLGERGFSPLPQPSPSFSTHPLKPIPFDTCLLQDNMKLIILDHYSQASEWAAKYIRNRIIQFNPGPDKYFTLGLPTGALLEGEDSMDRGERVGIRGF